MMPEEVVWKKIALLKINENIDQLSRLIKDLEQLHTEAEIMTNVQTSIRHIDQGKELLIEAAIKLWQNM